MADQAALEMIARIRDEATPILKNLQREMDRLGKGSAVRDMRDRFSDLNSASSKLGGELKSVLAPAIGAIGLGSLSAGAAVGIMISKLKSMGEGAVKFKYLEQVTGTAAGQIATIGHASERLGVDAEAAAAAYENWGRIVGDMTGGPMKQAVGQAAQIRDTLRASGPFGRELANAMRQFALANPKDTFGAFTLALDMIGTRSPAEQARLNEILKFPKQWIDMAKRLAAEKPSGIKKEDIELMLRYNEAMINLDHTASKLWKTLALKVEPFFELQLKAANAFLEALGWIEKKLEGVGVNWTRILTGGVDVIGIMKSLRNQLADDHMPPLKGPGGEPVMGNNGGWPVAKPVQPVPVPPPAPAPPAPPAPAPAPRAGVEPRASYRRFEYGGPEVFSSGQTPARNEAIAADLLARGRKRFLEMENEADKKRLDEIKIPVAPKPPEPKREPPVARPEAPARGGFSRTWDDMQEQLKTVEPKAAGDARQLQQRGMETILDRLPKVEPRAAPIVPAPQPQPIGPQRIEIEQPRPQSQNRGTFDPKGWADSIARGRQDDQPQAMFPDLKRLDRSLAAQTGAVRVEGGASIDVNVVAPKGTSVDATTRGMFNPPSISRSQQMGFANPNGEQPFTGNMGW